MRVVIAVLMLCSLAACATAQRQAAGPSFRATGLKGEPTIISTVSNDLLLIDITSPTGIGGARIEKTAGDWPPQIILRLRLTGLESLKFTYADRLVALEVPSSGNGEVLESVEIGAAPAMPLTVDSPYWMTVTPGRGYFDVAVPPDFFASGVDQFVVEWIDFYR